MKTQKRQKAIRFSIIISSIGIILILGVLGMFIFGREGDFLRYKGRQKRFSIKYPSTWTYSEGQGEIAVIFQSALVTDLDKFKENVNIVTQDISANPMSLDEYSEHAITQVQAVFKENIEILDAASVRFAGQPGFRFIYVTKPPDLEMKFMHYWMIKGTTAYQFTYGAMISQYEQYLSIAHKMRKSFKVQ